MELPFELQQQSVEFLISLPNIRDDKTQQALLLNAGLDRQLYDSIPDAESPAQFVQRLVHALFEYGTLRDGRNALTAVLIAAKEYVGQEGRETCALLIREMQKIAPVQSIVQQLTRRIKELKGNYMPVATRLKRMKKEGIDEEGELLGSATE